VETWRRAGEELESIRRTEIESVDTREAVRQVFGGNAAAVPARSPTSGLVEQQACQLNAREASLVEAFRRLPPDTAAELSALAQRLAGLTPERRIDWSDSWSDEDLKEFRAPSLRRLDAEESEDSN
jgi:hypothetical protein